MKYIVTFLFAVSVITLLNSCGGTSAAFKKPAYINNDIVHLPNEKVTDITIIDVTHSSDKAMYEKISQELQSEFMKRGISSDMRFYDVNDGPTAIAAKIKETTKPYYLIVDKLISGTQKDELNNDFITNQINCMLVKTNGGHIADFTISIDNTTTSTKMGKTIGGLIISYLSKKNLI